MKKGVEEQRRKWRTAKCPHQRLHNHLQIILHFLLEKHKGSAYCTEAGKLLEAMIARGKKLDNVDVLETCRTGYTDFLRW